MTKREHNEPVEIVCGIDANYAPHLAVMLNSLVKSNPGQSIRVHVLHDVIAPELRKRVEQCNQHLTINWLSVENHPVLDFGGTLNHITCATFLRLLMVDLLSPSIKRVLYLDVDLIVTGDLRDLWNIDLGGKVCAAVVDPGIEANEFAAKWDLPGPGPYFNAGVMLFDLDKLRSEPFFQRAIRILAKHDNGCTYADQDALNIVLWNNWLPLDPGWNFQRKFLYNGYAAWRVLDPVKRDPVIIHYTENVKPWRKSDWHPCGWLYLRTLLRTPFRKEVLDAGEFNTTLLCKSWLRWLLKRPPMFRSHNY
jgi:lipopolysaccharide biosynthesis glycosyltransferase